MAKKLSNKQLVIQHTKKMIDAKCKDLAERLKKELKAKYNKADEVWNVRGTVMLSNQFDRETLNDLRCRYEILERTNTTL
jgi:hypothetical protein